MTSEDTKLGDRQSCTRFISALVHELRTPLGSMLMLAEMLEAAPLNNRLQRQVENLRQAGQDVLSVLNETGELSRLLAGRVQVDPERLPTALLQEASQEVAKSLPQLVLTLDRASDTPAHFLADRRRLGQVLETLLTVAARVCCGNPVEIAIRSAQLSSGGPAIAFTMGDHGPPLSAANAAQMLTPFSATDPRSARPHGGTSLELPTCAALVQLMGGELTVSGGDSGGLWHWLLPAG